MLKTIGNAIAAYVLPKLLEAVQEQVKLYLPVLMDKMLALLPVLAASAAKAVGDQLPDLIKSVLENDPDIPGISDVIDVSEMIRNGINNNPNIDVDIPFISDAVKNLTGFDLSDMLKGR